MLSLLGFLVILGPLVVFHELGHYLFARLFNVKAEIFSVGFGPRLWSRQLGETELRFSAIPLGGYVKLLGAEPDRELSAQELPRSVGAQAAWKRFLIYFGGPLFNLILAIFVFMAILAIGEPQMASVVGRVVEDSLAEKSGFRPGDRVTAVDGLPVSRYEELQREISSHPGKQIQISVVRKNATAPEILSVTPVPQAGFSIYGEATDVGEVDGLLPMSRATTVGVSDPESPAGKAGLKTGDKISGLDGTPVDNWETLAERFAALPAGSAFSVLTETVKGNKIALGPFKKTASASFSDLTGLFSSELFIEKTIDKAPAMGAGIQSGDRIVSVGTTPVRSFFGLRSAVQKEGETNGKVSVTWERAGKRTTAEMKPTSTIVKDPILRKSVQYTIGVIPQLVWNEPVMVIEQVWNPFLLVSRATQRMIEFSYRNLVSIGKMFTGEVSVNSLGGPILIGKIAGESLARGLIAFLTTLGVLSVSLGVLNLFPIPVLDGGHLLLITIEMVRRKPLSMRQMEIVQQVGLSLILLLMVIVMRNDLARIAFLD